MNRRMLGCLKEVKAIAAESRMVVTRGQSEAKVEILVKGQ
jgi:hypothetical protein